MKNKTARLFMLLASVLMLKICFGQVTFVSANKTTQKTYVYAADAQNTVVLNVARTEFDEDENEENKTEDFFVQLQHLQVFFHSFQRNNQLFIPESCYNKYTHHISIIKANHCFRI